MARRYHSAEVPCCDRAAELAGRARRLLARGETRRSLVALREACMLDESDAARWMRLGSLLERAGKFDEAARAMKQSLYLREAAGDDQRAAVVRRLLARLGSPADQASGWR